jgi:outer membrane receptor protein involved in Fe transport
MRNRLKLVNPMFFVAIACVLCLLSIPAGAQVIGATVSGTLTDPGGRVVPDAKVMITNTAQGIVRTVTSNHEGAYVAPNLVPGPYEMQVTATGFRTELKKGIVLTVGEESTINIALKVGSLDQTVVVEDTGTLLDLGNSALSAVVTGETIRELPLNGRDWTQVATLEPGTATVRSQPNATNPSSRGNRGFGQQLTVAGGRPQLNSYRIDGINVNDYANSSPGSSAGLSLGADAVGEFSVISSNYSASYGMTAGAVINAITRAGTNQYHGSAYEFVRNDLFDAESYFDVGKLPFRRNQFGATLGGPVIKDRTFLFGNYEGFRQVYTTTSNATTPTALARTGKLVCTTPSATCVNGYTQVTVSPLVQPYLPVWNLPTSNFKGDVGTYSFASKAVTPENFFTIRGDQIFSSKDSLYATYLYDNGYTTQPDTLNFNDQTNSAKRQMLSIVENHIFSSSFYNSFRVGANRVTASSLIKTPGANPLGSDSSLGAVDGLDAPLIAVGSGITSFTGGVKGGSAVHYGFTTPQISDDVFLNKGKHSLKFGFAFQRTQSNILIASYNYGNYTFTSFQNFLTNVPSNLSIATTPPTSIDLRQSNFGGYGEDSWHLRKNLTLTAGVRYEPTSVPTETANRLANLRTLSGTVSFGNPLFLNPTYKNVEPRVGFSYSPAVSNGKTILSGGYGVFDVLPLTWMFNLQLSQQGPYSLNLSSSTLAQGSFPKIAINSAIHGSGLPAQSYIQYAAPRNYVQQWNFTVQQELPGKVNFKLGYVGSHGVHQDFYTSDANVPQPVLNTRDALVFPCGTSTAPVLTCAAKTNTLLKVNQNVGAILASGWFTGSTYSGLLLDVRQQVGKSLQWQAAFTWQKSLDGSSSVVAGTPFQNSLNGFLFHPLKGVSDFNIPHVFVANGIWTSPRLIKHENVLSYLVNDWQVGGIYQISDGTPFSLTITGDNLGLGNGTPLDFPDRMTGTGCSGNPVNTGNRTTYVKVGCFQLPTNNTGVGGTRFGNEQRNSLRGPDFQELDFSLVKNFHVARLGEGRSLQFRAETFNLANHPNLSPPYTASTLIPVGGGSQLFQTTTATTGQITTTAASPRQIQLAAKLIF